DLEHGRWYPDIVSTSDQDLVTLQQRCGMPATCREQRGAGEPDVEDGVIDLSRRKRGAVGVDAAGHEHTPIVEQGGRMTGARRRHRCGHDKYAAVHPVA